MVIITFYCFCDLDHSKIFETSNIVLQRSLMGKHGFYNDHGKIPSETFFWDSNQVYSNISFLKNEQRLISFKNGCDLFFDVNLSKKGPICAFLLQ